MRISLLSCFLGLAFCGASHAQQATALNSGKLSDALVRIQSPDLRTREAGFDDLMAEMESAGHGQKQSSGPSETLSRFFSRYPDQANRVKLGLIQLLGKENETFMGKNVAPGSYTEEDTEHYAAVIDAVSSLNDARAIPALVGAITTGGMAARGLLKYGDNALNPVLKQLENPDPLVRSGALGVAVTILENKHDPASDSRIKSLLQSGLGDRDSAVRAQAVMLIDCFDQRQDFAPALEQIAKNDPDSFPGKSDDGADGEWYYPVRVQARRVLRDIQSNKTCKP